MFLHNVCMSLNSWLHSLQKFDPTLSKDDLWNREFISKWDDQIYSLIFTGAGTIPNPQWMNSGKNPSLLMGYLEQRFCLRNYQDRITLLEEILPIAIQRHGEDKILEFTRFDHLAIRGEESIDELKKAKFVLKNEELLRRLAAKSQARYKVKITL